ncbi:hypothetical protein QBC46DRAFT_422270 [Diplogelasinospora grovesii]|uniref:Uncharacterized protein n=1 Tax=Diplogelasinospora grovesii TaxID=303347 RepID=A0AAN6S7X7_9PEZI|nr:hypothetical protein QBC46DRAFT_422270 [Diplogelasinospora grovesii]
MTETWSEGSTVDVPDVGNLRRLLKCGVIRVPGVQWRRKRRWFSRYIGPQRCRRFGGLLEPDPEAVYFHSDRESVTYRVYELLPEQKQVLLDFLTADSPPPTCHLPILGDANNRNRVDPEEPSESTRIYRDMWERNENPPETGDDRLRDVWDKDDYPPLQDKGAAWKPTIICRDCARVIIAEHGEHIGFDATLVDQLVPLSSTSIVHF